MRAHREIHGDLLSSCGEFPVQRSFERVWVPTAGTHTHSNPSMFKSSCNYKHLHQTAVIAERDTLTHAQEVSLNSNLWSFPLQSFYSRVHKYLDSDTFFASVHHHSGLSIR